MNGYLIQPSPFWPPYFGNQKRFAPYVAELFRGLGLKPGDTYYETNAGSHAVACAARAHGLSTHVNDAGAYSQALGNALYGDESYRRRAAVGAAVLEKWGYDLEGFDPSSMAPGDDRVEAWERSLSDLRASCAAPGVPFSIRRGDLWDFVQECPGGDVLYTDFAWPWRDGRATGEYEVTADKLSAYLDGSAPAFRMSTARQIMGDVVRLLDMARPKFKWVVLSNQPSNFPPPEVIEPTMQACGHAWAVARRLSLPAEDVDNRGLHTEFTEYQYVFEGK